MKRLIQGGPVRSAARAASVIVLGLLLATLAQAQDGCRGRGAAVNPLLAATPGMGGSGAPRATPGGFGGTGIVAGRSGGIGGTGVVAGGEGGIGGTAIVAGRPGLGGTGIVGIVTGFASICVNGLEVQFDAATPVSDDGRPGSARQLAVGQVVAVQAAGSGAALSARSIALIHAAVGPIDAVNASTGEFRILGQSALALERSELAGLKPGDWVRVSGHRRAQGDIAATHIERAAPQAMAQLNGAVTELASGAIRVEGTLVRFDAQAMPAGLARGVEVAVSGRWDGASLQVSSLQIDPTRGVLGAVDTVVFEGYIHALSKQEISLGLGPLALSPQAQFVGGTAAQLGVNQRVQISGRVGADRQVTVERVEFREHDGNPGGPGSSKTESRHGSSGSEEGESKAGMGAGSSGPMHNSGAGGSAGGTGGSGGSGGTGGSGGSGGSHGGMH